MKNLKLYLKISIPVCVMLIAGLAVILVLAVSSAKAEIQSSTEDRLTEMADAKATVIETYFADYMRYMQAFTMVPEVAEVLQNPTDATATAAAQSALEAYVGTFDAMEGLFIMDPTSTILCHSNTPAIGAKVYDESKSDILQMVIDGVQSAPNHVYLRGISVSTSTGALVCTVFAGVYDTSGNLIGVVGGGCFLSDLQALLDSMTVEGLENAQMRLINLSNNLFLICPDEELVNTEVEDVAVLAIEEMVETQPAGIYTVTMEYAGSIMNVYNTLEDYNLLVIVSDTENEVYAGVKALTLRLVIVIAIILVVLLLITVIISKMVANGIVRVVKVIGDVGDTLDLTKAEELRESAKRKDEVGMMASATCKLTDAVSGAVASIRANAENVMSGTESAKEQITDSRRTAQDISSAVSDLANGATQMAQDVVSTSDVTDNIGSSVGRVLEAAQMNMENGRTVYDESIKVQQQLEHLRKADEETDRMAVQVADSVNQTATVVESISQAAESIISIASETNLLALNASIEAARAGEAGKGFAVVADNIKNLAEESNAAANKITSMLSEITALSDHNKELTESIKQATASETDELEKMNSIFEEMIRLLQNTEEGNREIVDLVETLNSDKQTILDSVNSLSGVSQMNAASSEETSASLIQLESNMEGVVGNAEDLQKIAEELQKNVSVFKI